MRRLNSAIDGKNLAQIQEALEPFGIKVSEALRIGLNLLASALPILAKGGTIIFRSRDGQRTYSLPISNELGQSWLPDAENESSGTKRLTGSVSDTAYLLIKSTFERFGLTMSDGMRKSVNLFAAALPTLNRPQGEIVLRSVDGIEQSFRFPFLATPVVAAQEESTPAHAYKEGEDVPAVLAVKLSNSPEP